MTTPAPHTPVSFLKSGGSAFFSKKCQQLLIECKINPDWFGSYDYVSKRLDVARDNVDAFRAATPAPPPPGRRVDEHGTEVPEPSREDLFLSECTAGHLVHGQSYSQLGGEPSNPCHNQTSGYVHGAQPCMPTEGSRNRAGSVEALVSDEEILQSGLQHERNAEAIAAGTAPATDANRYPAEQRRTDEAERIDTAVNAHRDGRFQDGLNRAHRRAHAGRDAPVVSGSGVDGRPVGGAEHAAARAQVGAKAPTQPENVPGGAVQGETAGECIKSWKDRAQQEAFTSGVKEEIESLKQARQNQTALADARAAAAAETARREAEVAAAQGAVPPDPAAVERARARRDIAQRAEVRAARELERANKAEASLGCLREQQRLLDGGGGQRDGTCEPLRP